MEGGRHGWGGGGAGLPGMAESLKRIVFLPSHKRSTRAIELGSGPGHTGLTAAMLVATVELTGVASADTSKHTPQL